MLEPQPEQALDRLAVITVEIVVCERPDGLVEVVRNLEGDALHGWFRWFCSGQYRPGIVWVTPGQAAAADVTVFEIREAAFVVTDGDEWQWVWLDEDHDPIRTSSESYSSADEAEDAVGTVNELAADVEFIDCDDAAFDPFETEAGWEWQLIDETGNELAESLQTYPAERTPARQ